MGSGEVSYKRLPGRGVGSGAVWSTRFRLWLGPDHVLSVANQGYSEEYKRFYFRDIQAIVVRRTFKWHYISIVSALFTSVFFAITLAVWYSSGFGISLFALVPATIFLVALIGNVIKGPTCVAYLRTAVQTEVLGSLNRLRTTMKVIHNILRPIIEGVQGTLPIAGEVGEGLPSPATVPSLPPDTLPFKPYRSRAHTVLFSILLLDLCHSGAQFVFHSMTIYFLSIPILIGLLATLIVALNKQSNTDLGPSIKTLTWCTLGYLSISYLWGTMYYMIFMMSHPSLQNNSLAYLKAVSTISPYESRSHLSMLLFSMFSSATIGFLGFVNLIRFHKTLRIPPPLPVTDRPISET